MVEAGLDVACGAGRSIRPENRLPIFFLSGSGEGGGYFLKGDENTAATCSLPGSATGGH